jgi:hypothetical protein
MKVKLYSFSLMLFSTMLVLSQNSSKPIVGETLVFGEKKGLIVVEAEHFYKQTFTDKRAWYINSPEHQPLVWPDHDVATYVDAGGLAYVEALPDLFNTESDPIIQNENLGGKGNVAVLHYKVNFDKMGRYYIWARLRSNDEEDNTTGAGINGVYPATAQILQSPVNQKKWIWKSDNRVSRKPWVIGRASIEVTKSGIQDVQFYMREDGEEFDRFVLTTDSFYTVPEGVGPAETIHSGKLPKAFSLKKLSLIQPMPMTNPDGAIYGANVVYLDTLNVFSFEAENFYVQRKTDSRHWHLVTKNQTPAIGPDSDPSHALGASEDAYLELLPDGRQKDEDGINSKNSICGEPGVKAILGYKFKADAPGRYYVWIRAYAVDGDDNTLHVGLNDQWPDSGKKMTFSGKLWKWSNTQRDTKAPIYIDVTTAGINELQLSMREDGCEIDRILLTKDKDYKPSDAVTIPTRFKGLMQPWYDRRESQMRTAAKYVQDQESILIEVESQPVNGDWGYAADKSGHSGLGYLEWKTEGQGTKAGKGILKYSFEITQAGNYQFLLRGKIADPKNRMDTLDPDGNDIWVKFNGGTEVKNQKSIGNDWNKVLIIGHPEGWTWNTNADGGKEHPITPVCRYFEKGTYSIELSGRSQGYAIDKIALIKYKSKPLIDFQNTVLEDSTKNSETKTVRL